jgi:hypothetical protein
MVYIVPTNVRNKLKESSRNEMNRDAMWYSEVLDHLDDVKWNAFSNKEKTQISKWVLNDDKKAIRDLIADLKERNLWYYRVTFDLVTCFIMTSSVIASFVMFLWSLPVIACVYSAINFLACIFFGRMDSQHKTYKTLKLAGLLLLGYTIFAIVFYNWDLIKWIVAPLAGLLVGSFVWFYTPALEMFKSAANGARWALSGLLPSRTAEKKQEPEQEQEEATNSSSDNTTARECPPWNACDAHDYLAGMGGFQGLQATLGGVVQLLLAANMSYVLLQGSGNTTSFLPGAEKLPPIFQQQARLREGIVGMLQTDKNMYKVDFEALDNKFQKFVREHARQKIEDEKKRVLDDEKKGREWYVQLLASMVTGVGSAVATNIAWKLGRIVFWSGVNWIGKNAEAHPFLQVAHVALTVLPGLLVQINGAASSTLGFHTLVGVCVSSVTYAALKYGANFLWEYAGKALAYDAYAAAAEADLLRRFQSAEAAETRSAEAGEPAPPAGPGKLATAAGKIIGRVNK